ncbi:MAG TPA: hypothetical protein VMS75_05040 [Terriglobales bacterium]|nr:hypothetical protein [Terriglobales bacterium]
MQPKLFRIILGALFAALAASCVMVMDPGRGEPWPANPEFRRTVDFAPGGVFALEHTLGDIVITGRDGDSAELVATVRPEESAESRVRVYAAADLEPSIDVRKAGSRLRIRTKSLGGPWSSGGLDYAIRLPHSVNLDPIVLEKGDISVSGVYGRMSVELGTGSLKVANFSGPLKASVESGQADVELLDVRPDDVVQVTVGEGDIVLRLEPGAGARIEAEAPRAEITSDFDLGRSLPARTLDGRLGSGEARIVLRALRGNIRILKTG